MKKKLKLFVWEDVLKDYTSGIMFALAHDVEEAREIILKEEGDYDSVVQDLKQQPLVVDSPQGFVVWGGG